VKGPRRTPSFTGLAPASQRARRAARGSSKKRGTKCELALRRLLRAKGLRYRLNVSGLPGKPDIVFLQPRIAVFCDGDFWHGRDLKARLTRLAAGHNATYWLHKIRTNVERDRRHTQRLIAYGWRVLRLWETDILRDPEAAAARVEALVREAPAERGCQRYEPPAPRRARDRAP
jgi:DNA mismatch endonuclease (patch repair protein)